MLSNDTWCLGLTIFIQAMTRQVVMAFGERFILLTVREWWTFLLLHSDILSLRMTITIYSWLSCGFCHLTSITIVSHEMCIFFLRNVSKNDTIHILLGVLDTESTVHWWITTGLLTFSGSLGSYAFSPCWISFLLSYPISFPS